MWGKQGRRRIRPKVLPRRKRTRYRKRWNRLEDDQPETEQTEESQTEDVTASPLMMNLQQSTVRKVVPEHHKYIRYNGNDSYTLTLDVKGAYASESIRPKVDVLLIIDKSGSMNEEIRNGYKRQSKMAVLKNVVSGTNGLTEAILGTRSTLDARMAVVSYSGNKSDGTYNDAGRAGVDGQQSND